MSGTPLSTTFDLGTFLEPGATPSAAVQGNLRALHALLLTIQRTLGGAPMLVTSGYRDPARNSEVGGVPQSQHLSGSAADVVVQGVPLAVVAQRLDAALARGEFTVGQFVYYPAELAPGVNKGHLHVGLPNGQSRNRQLIHLAGDKYIDLNPANWPAYAQVGVGAGLLLLAVLAVLLVLRD